MPSGTGDVIPVPGPSHTRTSSCSSSHRPPTWSRATPRRPQRRPPPLPVPGARPPHSVPQPGPAPREPRASSRQRPAPSRGHHHQHASQRRRPPARGAGRIVHRIRRAAVLALGPWPMFVTGGWCVGVGDDSPCDVPGNLDVLRPGPAAAKLAKFLAARLSYRSFYSQQCIWD